jgi:aspartate/methionine/tyrosine aminotransferase
MHAGASSASHAESRPGQVAARLRNFRQTIFTEMSLLAAKHGAVNLGQGFPDFDGPDFVKRAAIDAINSGKGQYARMFGIPELNRAIASHWQKRFDLRGRGPIDPDTEVTVTSGCTEAIAATLIGLVNPGDEVIVFEPFYDSYPACIAMAGATMRAVTLTPPEFAFDEAELRRAFTNRTRAILINSPHNPTGKVFSRRELELIASLCIEHDCIAITDEVYEHLVFDGEHIPLATLSGGGMYERTVTLSSLGKTFSLTGWKVGWSICSPELTSGVRAAHQFLTFATGTPLQYGAIAALDAPDSYYREFLDGYRRKRDLLVDGLSRVGFTVFPPAGTYFIMADHSGISGGADDVAFCRHLVEHVKVAAIPPSSFYTDPVRGRGRSLVRFAFCKKEETLREGIRRMEALR